MHSAHGIVALAASANLVGPFMQKGDMKPPLFAFAADKARK